MTEKLKLVFAADHAGYELKNQLRDAAEKQGYVVSDVGTHAADSVDYPDYAHRGAEAIIGGQADLGIFVCGSGTGMAISANKTQGVRAANAWSAEIAKLAREHNDANVLCIPGRFMSPADAEAIMQAFLSAEFQAGRHATRVGKIEAC
jgi:ribose 5-phosphate isomerase B